MTNIAPDSHLREAQTLTADAPVDLYKIVTRIGPATIFYFKNDDTVTWRGNEYQGMACRITGDSQTADGEESRPTLQIMNPYGVFNTAIVNGRMDLAVITRYRVLRRHIDSDSDIKQQRMWYMGRVKELISGQSASFELRSMTEGPNFQIPVRMYIPPEFPTVSL